uniref:Uncharacterized protein n=1 Tax=Glossina pallidipes TaxID=7398 RepID=A0A1A9Z1T4_GLOPL
MDSQIYGFRLFVKILNAPFLCSCKGFTVRLDPRRRLYPTQLLTILPLLQSMRYCEEQVKQPSYNLRLETLQVDVLNDWAVFSSRLLGNSSFFGQPISHNVDS